MARWLMIKHLHEHTCAHSHMHTHVHTYMHSKTCVYIRIHKFLHSSCQSWTDGLVFSLTTGPIDAVLSHLLQVTRSNMSLPLWLQSSPISFFSSSLSTVFYATFLAHSNDLVICLLHLYSAHIQFSTELLCILSFMHPCYSSTGTYSIFFRSISHTTLHQASFWVK